MTCALASDPRSAYGNAPSEQTRPGEIPPNTVRLGEVLGALSHALDLTEGQPPGHSMRCAWIATAIGREMGLSDEALGTVYLATLLKDLGCSSNAARICELYLTDDLALKRDFKTIDGSLPAALKFVLTHTGTQSRLTERVGAIVNILRNGGEIVDEMIETRCDRGATIARKMGLNEDVAASIHALDEHWDGSGRPIGISGDAIPLAARVALLSQVADIFWSARGPDAARREVAKRSGGWLDPTLCVVFADLAADPAFLATLGESDVEARVLALAPARISSEADEDTLDRVAGAFADVIDAKSPFTAGHSRRVTLYADMIAQEMGMAEVERRTLRRAGLLHDVGKLGVSNDILDKPGKPDEAQWAAIRLHPVHGERILSRVAALRPLAPLAAAHHERLDGKGYPYALKADDLAPEVRMLTVADVFDALHADRPYRAAMPIERALAILDQDTGTAFDGDCVAALKRGLSRTIDART